MTYRIEMLVPVSIFVDGDDIEQCRSLARSAAIEAIENSDCLNNIPETAVVVRATQSHIYPYNEAE